MAEEQSYNSLLNDSQWSVIDGEMCRVIDFTPISGTFKNGQVSSLDKSNPYASVTLECKKLPPKTTGFITHKDDVNPEARSWFVCYFMWWHPEENVDKMSNKDVQYDEGRTAITLQY